MGLFDNFPYTNFHELNLDWMLNALRVLEHTINDFVAINALKYADPIQWNITSQYEKNTIVIDPQTGTAYISVQPVPAGVSLTNTDYWTVVFDLGSFVVKASKNFTDRYEADTTTTATFSSNIGDWLVWADTLYIAISNITAGDAYVINSNIRHFTIEDIIGHLTDLTTVDQSNIVAAINELVSSISAVDAKIGDLDNLITTDKSSVVNAINDEVTARANTDTALSNDIGDLSTLNTTDKSSLVNAVNEVISDTDNKIKAMEVSEIRNLIGNLLLNDINSDGLALNGCCYAGNNLLVAYYSDNGVSNTGKLKAYNLETFSLAWEHSIVGYHGNSITYNPTNDHIYICAMKDNTNNADLNIIIEIDMAQPDTVLRTFPLPDTTQCLSLVYDIEKDLYYATVNGGATPGVSDLLYIYNSDLTELVQSVLLKEYPATTYGLSMQGVQLAKDGIVYAVTYEDKCHYIMGWTATTGDVVAIAATPNIINSCRAVGEVQAFCYDYDHDRYIVCSELVRTGLLTYNRCANFFEVDLVKGIVVFEPIPTNTNFESGNSNRSILGVVMAANTYRPMFRVGNSNYLALPNDALVYCRVKGRSVDIKFYHTYSSISERTDKIYDLDISGYKGRIEGYANGDPVTFYRTHFESTCYPRFLWCTFEGYEYATGTFMNMFIGAGSKVYTQACNYPDYAGTGYRCHIMCREGSEIRSSGDTYTGTVNADRNLAGCSNEIVE